MTANIHYLKPPLREIPTQEIRSIYQGLADASYIFDEEAALERKQNMEKTMIDLHDKMHPDIEFDYRLWWLVVLPFWGFIAFLIGFGLGGA